MISRPLLSTILLSGLVAAIGPRDQPPTQEEIRKWRWNWEERKLTGKKYWRHDKTQEPPYRPPANWIYNTSSGPVEGKINVHLIPHTHDDTGWQVTVDQYFYEQVYYIIDNVVRRLSEDPNRRFMYVETGFFARWWQTQPETVKNMTRKLVENGQLEFINGGWCMHDEAAPYYVEMVDQTTRGHIFLNKEFGMAGNPKGTWQIDPFGHSNTQSWLLSAEAGMGSLFWGRMDYQDFNKRKPEKGLEWIWRASQSLGKSAEIFAGELYDGGQGGYGAPISFDGSSGQIQDDPTRHDYNVDQMLEKFLGFVTDQASHTRTNHIAWACGSDFNYQNAAHWYHNLDKLIHYANLNGTVNAFYSTPSFYVEQKHKAGVEWEVREDDIFPLADAPHHYWTGYFTSRPALKRQVRFASNLLNAARQMETISGVSKTEVGLATTRPSPPVGNGWTDSLEGTIGIATHHDGMSGTERQDVADDYELRIAESQVEVEEGIVKSLSKLMGSDSGNTNIATHNFSHCSCAQMNSCLNISMCAFTADSKDGFSVIAWSPLGQPSEQIARVPVTGSTWKVTEVASGKAIEAQAVPIDQITKNLPLLYINYFQLTPEQIDAKKKEYANTATHVLLFPIELPAVGYNTYVVDSSSQEERNTINTNSNNSNENSTTTSTPFEILETDPDATFGNDFYEVTFDGNTGMPKTLRNKKSGVSAAFNIHWGWYNSSTGGCTREIPGPPYSEAQCDPQASGAYIFRPNSSIVFRPGPQPRPSVTVTNGSLVVEIRQQFSDWTSHVIRLIKGQPYVEVEWTAGPIPMHTNWIEGEGDTGKEVIIKYSTSLDSKGKFETDSNGRELVERVYNQRGKSYPQPYNISEPVAGNYYPVNAMIAIKDEKKDAELVVITDASMGGASLSSGEIEMMVHRRILQDDVRGVQEPLNETMCGCNDINAPPGQMGAHGHLGDGGCECAGLTMRGRHWLVLDTIESANDMRRKLDNLLNFPATLTFADKAVGTGARTPKAEYLSEPLPENVKLMTLTDNYKHAMGGTLLRLSHLYSVGEHPTLSLPAKVSLSAVFAGKGLKIKTVEETSLTGNQPLKELDASKLVWKTYDPSHYDPPKPYDERVYMNPDGFVVELRPMELRTFWVTFE